MTEYLFPFFNDEIEQIEETENIIEDEVYRDVAWDYDCNIPIIANGDFVIVEGLEAVKSWAFRALQTQRARYSAFSWNYGVDIESYIGKVLNTKQKIDITKEIEECLMQNKHITNATDFNFTIDKRKVTISFKIITEYGEEKVNVQADVTNVVENNERQYISLQGVRVHFGDIEPSDTIFWYDTRNNWEVE